MRKSSYLIILIFFTGYSQVNGQDARIKIYGERNDDVVSLAWIPEFWPEGMEGMIIKRKEVNGAWNLVTKTPVVPSSFSGKDLTNVETLSSERLRLAAKLDSMIANNQASPVSEKEYFEEILQNRSSLTGIAFIFALDYDLLLLNGFGCTDRSIEKDVKYTYGLFPVISGTVSLEPVSSYETPVGGKPDLDLVMTPSIEVIGNNKKLRIHWQFSLDEFVDKNIKGFDIYEQRKEGKSRQLNDNVIWITSKDNPADLSYVVPFPEQTTEYIAFPISYFGAFGDGKKSLFSPAKFNIVLPPPKLSSQIESKNLTLSWEMNHGYDSLIEKYSILKKENKENFEILIDLNAKSREFISRLNSNGEQSQYKVRALTKTGKEIWSNAVVVNYSEPIQVSAPFDLQGEIIEQDGNSFIELSWRYPRLEQEVAFRIFSDGPDDNLIYDSSFPKDLKSPFRIEVKKSRGQLYHFAVQARALDRTTSSLSNEVEVLAPSRLLPPIAITNLTVDEGEVLVEWHFDMGIADLKGFRIMLDGEMIILEDVATAEIRNAKLKVVGQGKHSISITAVTQFGLESTPSQTKNIIVQ